MIIKIEKVTENLEDVIYKKMLQYKCLNSQLRERLNHNFSQNRVSVSATDFQTKSTL